MPELNQALKNAILANEFNKVNDLLKDTIIRSTAHLNNNYALKQVTKLGVLSCVKELLKINAVWLSFDADELLHLADKYSNHPGVNRLVRETILKRFEQLLSTINTNKDVEQVKTMLETSTFIQKNAAYKNNLFIRLAIKKGVLSLVQDLLKIHDVAKNCGMYESFLAAAHSNHPGIVREINKLKNKSILLVNDEPKMKSKLDADTDMEYIVEYVEFLPDNEIKENIKQSVTPKIIKELDEEKETLLAMQSLFSTKSILGKRRTDCNEYDEDSESEEYSEVFDELTSESPFTDEFTDLDELPTESALADEEEKYWESESDKDSECDLDKEVILLSLHSLFKQVPSQDKPDMRVPNTSNFRTL